MQRVLCRHASYDSGGGAARDEVAMPRAQVFETVTRFMGLLRVTAHPDVNAAALFVLKAHLSFLLESGALVRAFELGGAGVCSTRRLGQLLQEIYDVLQDSLVPVGEPVGTIAAQALSQSAIQSMLSAFHSSAGSKKGEEDDGLKFLVNPVSTRTK